MKYNTFKAFFLALTIWGSCLNAQKTIPDVQNEISDFNQKLNYPVQTESIIVSRDVYESILEWLSLDSNDSTPLDIFLINEESLNENEVSEFINEYFTDLAPRNQEQRPYLGKMMDDEEPDADETEFTFCDCKNVIPRESSRSKSDHYTVPPKLEIENGGIFGNTGKFSIWRYFFAKGLAYEFKHEMAFNDIAQHHQWGFQERETFEILYLCTQEGLRSNSCNCDKKAKLVGEFQFDMRHEAEITTNGSILDSWFRLGFFAWEADRDVVNFNPTNFRSPMNPFVPIEAEVYQIGLQQEDLIGAPYHSQSWDWQGMKSTSPFALIYDSLPGGPTNNDNYYSVFTNDRGNFLKDLGNDDPLIPYNLRHTSFNSNNETLTNQTISIDHDLTLRANIPKVFVFSSAVYSYFRVDKNRGAGISLANTDFWTALVVPSQKEGYGNSVNGSNGEFANGEVNENVEDPCCNHDFARFSYSVRNDVDRVDEIELDIRSVLNSSFYGRNLDFGQGIGAIVTEGEVAEVTDSIGFVFDLMGCEENCNEFVIGQDQNGLPILWQPIIEVSGDPCSGEVDVEILNISELSNLPNTSGPITVEIFNDYASSGVTWFPAVMPSGVNSGNSNLFTGPFKVLAQIPQSGSEPRVHYKIVFTSSEGCQVLGTFSVPLCDNSTHINCLEAGLKVIPNPVNEGVTLEIDWSNWAITCPDFVNPPNGSGISNTFIVEIYNMHGQRVMNYGPFNGVGPGSIGIPYADWPSTPAFYIVKITFSNFTTITRKVYVW